MLTPRHQMWKKLDADTFDVDLLNMKNKKKFLSHQHMFDTHHACTEYEKKLDADMFGADPST